MKYYDREVKQILNALYGAKKEEKTERMKYYSVLAIIEAKDEISVKNKFIRDYDYYPIVLIRELDL